MSFTQACTLQLIALCDQGLRVSSSASSQLAISSLALTLLATASA